MDKLVKARFSCTADSKTGIFYSDKGKRFLAVDQQADQSLAKIMRGLTGGQWVWVKTGPFSHTKAGESATLEDLRRYEDPDLLEFVELLADGNAVFCNALAENTTLTGIPGVREQFAGLQPKQLITAYIAYPFEEGGFGEVQRFDLEG